MDGGRVASRWRYERLVAAGLACYGVVYLFTAVLAVEVVAGRDASASSSGALAAVAAAPLGTVFLCGAAASLGALAVWQALEAVRGGSVKNRVRWTRRVSALGRACTYFFLTVLCVATAGHVHRPHRLGSAVSARLLSSTAGAVLVAAVGGIVVAVGVSQVVRGLRRSFRRDLTEPASTRLLAFGVAGYIAKGIALSLIGFLFLSAAATHDSTRLGGMDVALARLARRSNGTVLLLAVAAGLACFGLYCIAWSRHVAARLSGTNGRLPDRARSR